MESRGKTRNNRPPMGVRFKEYKETGNPSQVPRYKEDGILQRRINLRCATTGGIDLEQGEKNSQKTSGKIIKGQYSN